MMRSTSHGPVGTSALRHGLVNPYDMQRRSFTRRDGIAISLIAAAHFAALPLLQLRGPTLSQPRTAIYLQLVVPAKRSLPRVPIIAQEVSVKRARIRPRATRVPAAPELIASDEAARVPAPESVAPAQDRASTMLNPGPGILERARSMAGKIDHDLRADQPAVSSNLGSTPMKRFRQALEGAYKGGGASFVTDRYVAADGVVITRTSRGNGTRCFISQLVNASPAAVLNGNTGGAREVSCPSGNVTWQRQ